MSSKTCCIAGRAATVKPLTDWSVSQLWKSFSTIAGASSGVGAISRIK